MQVAQNEVPKSPKAFHGWASAEKSNADSNQVTVGPYIIQANSVPASMCRQRMRNTLAKTNSTHRWIMIADPR